jgi:diguanylate cyclase (GGDEF)-like protein
MKLALAHARREGLKFAVMFIDLDGFKQINVVFGHSAGDILLQAVSVRLTTCLREADTLARIGGDEFVLLLPVVRALEEVRVIATKLLNEIQTLFLLDGYSVPLTASIGIALFPDNGETFDNLINAADHAMYHIKHSTKNGYAFLSDLTEGNRRENIF